MHWFDHGFGMGWMWFWWLAAGIVAVVAVWSMLRQRDREGPRPESPEEILKRRYASGEIDRAQYERTLGDLRR